MCRCFWTNWLEFPPPEFDLQSRNGLCPAMRSSGGVFAPSSNQWVLVLVDFPFMDEFWLQPGGMKGASTHQQVKFGRSETRIAFADFKEICWLTVRLFVGWSVCGFVCLRQDHALMDSKQIACKLGSRLPGWLMIDMGWLHFLPSTRQLPSVSVLKWPSRANRMAFRLSKDTSQSNLWLCQTQMQQTQ